ncbi:MAG: GNAT family protein [Patescibacteria group bacterium]
MEKTKEKQRVVFLKGKKTVLRPFKKDTDLELVLRWINDQEVTQYLSRYLPASIKEEEEWFDNLSTRKNDLIFAVETLEGALIGSMGLHSINWKDRVANHGVIIGEKEYWSKGYGKDAHMILLDYAFNSLNLRKVCSQVISFNERSLNYHLTCGYKEEGSQLKQFYKKGQYWDLIILGLFKEEWLIKWGEYNK